MKKLSLLILPMAYAVLLAASAACGGGDDNGGSNTPVSTATGTAARTATGSATRTATNTADAGEDGTGDSDYYNQVADILNEADQQTLDISQQYGGPYNDTADEIDQTGTAFSQTGQVFESTLLSLADLDPPADTQNAHQGYFDSVKAAAMLFSLAVADLEAVSTDAQLTAFKNEYGPHLDNASAAIQADCLVLQGLANSADSGADLRCSVQN